MKDLREKIAELREHHEFEARKTMSGLNAVTKSLQSGQDYNVVKKQIQKIRPLIGYEKIKLQGNLILEINDNSSLESLVTEIFISKSPELNA